MATSGRGKGGARRPTGLQVGAILTGTIVGQAKKGVMVELGSTELLLPRSKYGAVADRIEEALYGDALTVEVVADPTHQSKVGLTRVGIERALRQPRPIEGRLARDGAGFVLTPADGSEPFAAFPVDTFDPDDLCQTTTSWLVSAPHRDRRFVLPG